MPKVALIMGSQSDLPTLQPAIKRLRSFEVEVEVRIMSAHRTPDLAANFSKSARENGFDLLIAAAGKAAHLPGVLAAFTTLPVIGVPVKSSFLDGMDSLLSIVQMPPGIPVATVGIDAADNAAILAVQMLALKYPELEPKLKAFKAEMEAKVLETDQNLQKGANC
ncbi:MAG: 5-(carboxyamino)imidazole ribonucleotide mutase [Eubacteriales bacterium]|nr:5-(carboxyamino)imidazole ribonucleotide mutase [Eubacteriales bacterium]